MINFFAQILLLILPLMGNGAIDNFLDTKLSEYQRYEYEIKNMPEEAKLIGVDDSREFKLFGNLAYLPVMLNEKGHDKQGYLTLELKLFKKVLVARRDIERKSEISLSDFVFEVKDVSKLRGEPVNNPLELVGARTKAFVKRDEILIEDYLERMPIIKVGSRITAQSKYGNVQITFEAFAKQEGAEGEIIRIRTKDNKVYRAEVIDNKNVLVIE